MPRLRYIEKSEKTPRISALIESVPSWEDACALNPKLTEGVAQVAAE